MYNGAMDNILVTGGCGFLGSAIVKALVDDGCENIRVLALPGETTRNIDGLQVEVVRGNVLEQDACIAAVKDITTVFHTAAIYKSFMPDPTAMYEVNNRGTFNMMEASRREGVKTVVYTASIVALGRPPEGELGDEDTKYDAWDLKFAYSRAKYHSRKIAEDFGNWGMDVRVVCPGMVFGPGDIGPTPSGKLIVDVLKMKTWAQTPKAILQNLRNGEADALPPTYVEGGASFVDVRDAARVHVLAVKKGRPNRRYLATAHNLSQADFLQAVNRALSIDRRYLKLPTPIARKMIDVFETQAIKTNTEPPMARSFFEYALKPSFFSNQRSIEELGATYRPIEETIQDAVGYFKEMGYA